MSNDVTTPKVGTILDGTVGRDAIHFALAPVWALTALKPNDEIVVEEGWARLLMEGEKSVAVIDPWLKLRGIHEVAPGQQVYAFVHPGTITALRHVWQHPAFEIRVPKGGAQ